MKNQRSFSYYVGDFETTVFKGQQETEVWASAIVPLWSEDVKIFHSIEDTYKYLRGCGNCIVYYHNLKFDGSFWLDYLMNNGFTQAYVNCDEWIEKQFTGKTDEPLDQYYDNKMPNKSFNYMISDQGQWYRIKIKINYHIIELRDSLKLLPFSVRKLGKDFNTKHKKLDMDYEGVRWAGCEITDMERKYIANDVLVVKEALEIMFEQGHDSITIGSCCLKEYKNIISPEQYDDWFPNLYEAEINADLYGDSNVGEYIRRSYRGGWCYLVKGKENKVYKKGTTADVNSLYPSVMHSESGSRYPVGYPKMWSGNYIPDEAFRNDRYFFVRIKTRFYIKENMLPFIQKKNTFMYLGTESLETSDIKSTVDGKYYTYYTDSDGNVHDTRMTMTMTQTDYKLFLEHYDVADFEILDGCYFQAETGIFDEYINKYKEIKIKSKGAMRTLAKLFLNNLYGKMAASTDSTFRVAYKKEDGTLGFLRCVQHDKKPGYIPVGSAITSYARNFTIRAAQKNYHGKNKPGFIYADTDSIHCDLSPAELVGVPVHPTDFCHWKLESCWDRAIFARQKTYIEHITHEDLQPVLSPYYNIKCAGMPDKCKTLLNISMTTQTPPKYIDGTDLPAKWTQDELNFMTKKRTLKDFQKGLVIPGKLLPKRIRGGVILQETTYEMR